MMSRPNVKLDDFAPIVIKTTLFSDSKNTGLYV